MSRPYVSTFTTALTNGQCDVRAVGIASAQCQAMTAGCTYRFVSSTNCWLKFGSNPTASATDGNVYLPADVELFVLCQGTSTVCAVIRDTADGNLSQTLVNP